MHWNGGRCLVLTYLGETYLLAGKSHEAGETAGLALTLSQRHLERGDEAWSLKLLGEIVARTGDRAGAQRRFADALVLAETLGMRQLVARCEEALGRLA